ncbi:MAG: DUF2125 domain-containing protein [Beijerinckiaceae bacterium]
MRKIVSIVVLLGASAAAWTAAWFWVAGKADQAIDGWIADEKGRDRLWACANRSSEGFPFELRISCAQPIFSSQAGPLASASAVQLVASTGILAPRDIAFTIDGPLNVLGRDGTATASWSSLEGSFRVGGESPDVTVRATSLRVATASGAVSTWSGATVGALGVRMHRSPDRAPGVDAQALMLNIEGARAGPVDAFFGNEALLRASASAIILNASVANLGNFAERVERWAASGGRVQISTLTVEKGGSRLEASGDLTLDDHRRPAGQLSVRLAGIQPILARLNLPAAPLAIEGLLRGAGGRGGGSNLIENRQLPLELRGGRIYIGPLRLPVVLPPLI